MAAIDTFLRTHWDASRAPVVACLQYQSVPHQQSYRLAIARDGIELHAVSDTGAAGLFSSRKKKRDDFELISWADVLGAAVLATGGSNSNLMETDDEDEIAVVDFAIYGCISKNDGAKRVHSLSPFVDRLNKPVREAVERAMCHWTFRSAGADSRKKINHLVKLIQTLADPRAFSESTVATSEKASLAVTQPTLGLRRRKYLVYVNPVGGTGRAMQIFQSLVAPVLEQSQIEYEIVVTQHQAHATELVQELPLDTYDCIVAIGGDGLLSELLQGIMKREDWKRAIRQPIGVIPGGSGNGLASTLLSRANEKLHALNAAYALAKGVVHDLDISTVLNSHQEVMYSFLSLEWAFIADVDIESERFRMFGGLRFTISAIAKILSSQVSFAGKIRYLSSDCDKERPPKYHDRHHGFDGELAPAFDCFAARPEQTIPHVEGEWKEIAGDFHLFWGMNVSHGASDAHVAPGAGINDGYYYLCCAPAPFSRIELAKLLLGLENGSHVLQKQVQLIRTRAFTLEVNNAADLVVVDGERFNGPKVQVEVHRALGRVVCLPDSRY